MTDNTTLGTSMLAGEDAAFFADQQRRREELAMRISMFCDHINLPGEDGDAAYDLLREAAARIGSDRLRFARTGEREQSTLGTTEASGLGGELLTKACALRADSLVDLHLLAGLLDRAAEALRHTPDTVAKAPDDGARDWSGFKPDLGAPTPEPPLREIIYGYYAEHFDMDRAMDLTTSYIEDIDAYLTLPNEAAPQAGDSERWQPIETAPDDIGPCLVIEDTAMTTRWHFAACSDGNWYDLSDQEKIAHPTHWYPLPAAPGGSQ